MSAPIFLASGNRMKRVMWKGPGGTWGDLAALHKKGARGETRADARIVARASSPFPFVRRSFSRWLVVRLRARRKPPDSTVAAHETSDRARGRPASRDRPGRVFARARFFVRVADPFLPPLPPPPVRRFVRPDRRASRFSRRVFLNEKPKKQPFTWTKTARSLWSSS